MTRVTAAHLVRLREKYRILAALRADRETAQTRGLTEFPTDEKQPRRVAMKSLAAEFPGSLRELDDASAEELRARFDALNGRERAPWMEAAVLFHWALREALRLRRGAGEATFWDAAGRALVLAPPTGRLLDVVWTAVGRELGITPRAAEQLVYPHAPERGVRR